MLEGSLHQCFLLCFVTEGNLSALWQKKLNFQVCVFSFSDKKKKKVHPYQCSLDPETNGSYELIVLLNVSKTSCHFNQYQTLP